MIKKNKDKGNQKVGSMTVIKLQKMIQSTMIKLFVDHDIEMFDRMGQLEKRLNNNIIEFKDDILHEIVKLRKDNVSIIDQRDRIEDHEVQLEKIESHLFPQVFS